MYDWITEADIYRTRKALGEETDRLKRANLQERLRGLETCLGGHPEKARSPAY